MKVWKFILIYLVLFGGCALNVVIAIIYETEFADHIMPNIILVIIAVIIYTILDAIHQDAENSKCYKCGKTFAMKEISRELVRTEEGSVAVRTYFTDRPGYSDSEVPATKYTYLCEEECKYCGNRREIHKSEIEKEREY